MLSAAAAILIANDILATPPSHAPRAESFY
jgi:hypothetical protein